MLQDDLNAWSQWIVMSKDETEPQEIECNVVQ